MFLATLQGPKLLDQEPKIFYPLREPVPARPDFVKDLLLSPFDLAALSAEYTGGTHIPSSAGLASLVRRMLGAEVEQVTCGNKRRLFTGVFLFCV
jgi:hypothetical protein